MRIKSVTRDELYEQVWTTPISRLAKDFGISDVGLAKACAKHRIPRPPRGYWAKKEHGKSVRKLPLPPCNDPELQTIRLDKVGAGSTSRPSEGQLAARIREQGQVTVSDRLRSPHPLVVATKRGLENTKPGSDGLIEASGDNVFDVAVSRKSIGRAMRVLDALLKHWESIGGTAGAGTLVMDEDEIGVILSETTELAATRGKYERWQDVLRQPTGQLYLSVDGANGWGLRSNWSDGKRQRVEDLLTSFANGVVRHIEFLRQQRLDRECEVRQKNRALEVRKSKQRIADAESARRQELLALVRHFRRAQDIRRFLHHVASPPLRGGYSPDEAESRERWLAWAAWYADSIDPMVEAGPSPEQSQPRQPENIPFERLDVTSSTRSVLTRLGVQDSDALHQLSEEEVESERGQREWGTWREICRVLEGLGYDVSDRR